ncbi:hypothetical protein ABGB17_30170 [Sphaerisporangium sp. B11E5]|uniref:hypothetical protein n=1 Tax=Sphaerisporangium sp. B11E5 TaxID=3153563 RepID=UPI00325F21A2
MGDLVVVRPVAVPAYERTALVHPGGAGRDDRVVGVRDRLAVHRVVVADRAEDQAFTERGRGEDGEGAAGVTSEDDLVEAGLPARRVPDDHPPGVADHPGDPPAEVDLVPEPRRHRLVDRPGATVPGTPPRRRVQVEETHVEGEQRSRQADGLPRQHEVDELRFEHLVLELLGDAGHAEKPAHADEVEGIEERDQHGRGPVEDVETADQ